MGATAGLPSRAIYSDTAFENRYNLRSLCLCVSMTEHYYISIRPGADHVPLVFIFPSFGYESVARIDRPGEASPEFFEASHVSIASAV